MACFINMSAKCQTIASRFLNFWDYLSKFNWRMEWSLCQEGVLWRTVLNLKLKEELSATTIKNISDGWVQTHTHHPPPRQSFNWQMATAKDSRESRELPNWPLDWNTTRSFLMGATAKDWRGAIPALKTASDGLCAREQKASKWQRKRDRLWLL